MTNVAFLLNFTKEYKGGINYIKNLLYACSLENRADIKYFIFVPSDIEQEYIDIFSPYAEIVKTDILKRKTLSWFFEKVLENKFSTNFFMLKLLKKHEIDFVSHSNFFSRYNNLKIVNWIPDFQILHYPDLWTADEKKRTFKLYHNIIKYSDRIVLSSNDAFKDYLSFSNDGRDKVRVLQFVSQPGAVSKVEFETTLNLIKSKYNIQDNFFYLPNQFWSHKNHITAFKAINILKDKGLNPLLVTTGHMQDYRNNKKLNDTLNYIDENGLSANILLLGLIPYQEVLVLIKACVALINPSLFEGWSSTVEEAKSSGKKIILSDIAIHREQNPPNSIYFDALDEKELAMAMESTLQNGFYNSSDSFLTTQEVKNDLISRTKSFGQNYLKIIDDLLTQ
ncbi:glycosyltransferase involved in cell wall biosynthesis [Mucilaginibacter frigoritolerans]|jgi:glycosyltransferase involved in cell wall biosynthesis|uniref:Glycosyltransferase involved in cell wall biosynthesis n=1 Tax=Mucilaginibacter frigoritolerans TaxID=652788 RepID=A0A562TJX0_9SPHI|nr:glycosyltransferase family 1 protein [Mucilaginibacter frigoritolerans]TWI93815.1 glycosyltransferase involved in cell wall biosynthesis [Mucilaginibacter frigoritolerans]